MASPAARGNGSASPPSIQGGRAPQPPPRVPTAAGASVGLVQRAIQPKRVPQPCPSVPTPPCGSPQPPSRAVQGPIQAKRAPQTGPRVPAPAGGNVGPIQRPVQGAIQAKRGPRVPAPAGGNVGPVQRPAQRPLQGAIQAKRAPQAGPRVPPAAGGNVGVSTVQRLVPPGRPSGTNVFVILGDGTFKKGTLDGEVKEGYWVNVEGGARTHYTYAQLNPRDPRVVDGALGAQKWREFVRAEDQATASSAIYNKDGYFGMQVGAKNYATSMTAAMDRVSATLGQPLDVDSVESLHHLTSGHLRYGIDWRTDKDGVMEDGISLPAEYAPSADAASLSKEMSARVTGGGVYIKPLSMSPGEVQGALKALIKALRDSLSAARRDDDVLTAIAAFSQGFARLHPFADNNTRTNMLLVNKLLVENGFTPAIVREPKHFYTETREAWKQRIVDGMKTWGDLAAVNGGAPASSGAAAGAGAAAGPSPELLRMVAEIEARHRAILDLEVRVVELNGVMRAAAARLAEGGEQAALMANRVMMTFEQLRQLEARLASL